MKQGGAASGGFTIVETLIVLAVTGLLFAGAALMINGRQNRTEFTTAINNLQQQLQQIINQTASGYYPNSGNFSCTPGTPPSIKSGSNARGTNNGCIFLGSVIYFGPGQASNQFTVYPIAGNRVDGALHSVTTIPAAWPVAVAPGSSTNQTAPSAATTYTMENGLSYVWGPNPVNLNNPLGMGAISSLGGDASPTNNGSQAFRLYGFSNNWAGITGSPDVVEKIDTATVAGASAFIPWPGPLRACIASGSTNQSGLISVSQSLQVTLVIKDNTTCA